MSAQNMNPNEYAYLDLLPKKLDSKQKAVCFRTGNTIVAAGAGSGKTQVLATRFAWLVMSMGIPAPKILTLTFTKKAAGEMYERIYKTLSFFAENPETPELEKRRSRIALEDFLKLIFRPWTLTAIQLLSRQPTVMEYALILRQAAATLLKT